MSLTAEQSTALADETLNEETQPAEAPASGEQTTEPVEAPASGEQLADGETEDKAKEPAKETPEQKRAWTQVAAAKKAQVQVAHARQKLDQDVQRVRTYETQLEQEHKQRSEQLDARQRQIETQHERVKPLLDALERRDLNALVALGFDYEAFTRDAMTANTPEGIARRALEENKKLRERLDKDKEDARTNASITETRQIAQTLVGYVDSDAGATEFPDLYQWPPERIASEGLDLRAGHFRATRRQPTYAMVLNELQKRAKAEADLRTQRTTALQQRRSANPSDAGSAGKVDAKGASGSPGTPALSARTANERLSTPREKTEAEIDEECLAELRALRR